MSANGAQAEGVRFVVFGVAQPAGSKVAVPVGGGRWGVKDAAKGSAPWKIVVAQRAGEAMAGRPLLEGPLMLDLVFWQPRPKAQYGTGRNAERVKDSAPAWPVTRPDLLKLARAVEDALSRVCYRDDAQIVAERLAKRYGPHACVDVRVTPLPKEGR